MPVDHFIKFKTGWILPYDGIQSVIPAYSVKYLKCLFFKNLCYIPKVNFSVVFFFFIFFFCHVYFLPGLKLVSRNTWIQFHKFEIGS